MEHKEWHLEQKTNIDGAFFGGVKKIRKFVIFHEFERILRAGISVAVAVSYIQTYNV